MSTYLILFRFTQQGIQNIKESPARIQRARTPSKQWAPT